MGCKLEKRREARLVARIHRVLEGKSDPPPAPDYAGAAAAQGAANKEAAIAGAQISNPNIYGPYGSQTVTYANDPTTGNPVPTVKQTLSPEQQGLYNRNTQVQTGLANLSGDAIGTVQSVMGKPFNYGGQVQTSVNNPNAQTSLDTSNVAKMPVNAGTTAQQAIMSRLDPTLARARTSRETELTNQGLRPGMEAWDNAMKDVDFQENDQRTQAALQGINVDMNANNQGYNQALQSGQFANSGTGQNFSQGLQGAQFGNTSNAQNLQQALSLRELPLNEISALMSGSQVTNPQFQQYTGQNVQPAPVFGAAQAQGNYNQGTYNAQQAAQGAFYGGLAGLGGAALMSPTGTFGGISAMLKR